jgi:hypothetical protein
LKTDERRRILLNSIYGVDIDPQAVEVAKLSLLLKLIEGQQQYELEVGRLLPDLDANIRCGNSIIGVDFQLPMDVSDEERLRFNPFDWQGAFPAIFADGGFDAVIGNPPYFSVDAVWGRRDVRLAHLKAAYPEVHTDKTDVLFYFLKRAIDISRGEVGFIVSRSFLEATKARRLREWLAKNSRVREILDFQHAQVFPGVGINTAIVRLSHSRRTGPAAVRRFLPRGLPPGYTAETLEDQSVFENLQVNQSQFSAESWLFAATDNQRVLAKIDSAGMPVGDVLHIGQGMQTGRNNVFQGLSAAPLERDAGTSPFYYARVRNSDIEPYRIKDSGITLIYPDRAKKFGELPKPIRGHLRAHEGELKSRAAYQRGDCEWWRYTWPLHADYVDEPRIFCPYMSSRNRCALDEQCRFLGITDTTVLYSDGQPEDLHYLLGLLNSRALEFRFRFIGKLKGGGVYEYFENTVSRLPVPRRQPGDPEHDKLVEFVRRRVALAEEAAHELPGEEANSVKADVQELDEAINEHVYQLFGLDETDRAAIDAVLASTGDGEE